MITRVTIPANIAESEMPARIKRSVRSGARACQPRDEHRGRQARHEGQERVERRGDAQRDGEGDRAGGPGARAGHIRVDQRIAQHALQQGPGHRQGRPDQHSQQHPREAQRPEHPGRVVLRVRMSQGPEDDRGGEGHGAERRPTTTAASIARANAANPAARAGRPAIQSFHARRLRHRRSRESTSHAACLLRRLPHPVRGCGPRNARRPSRDDSAFCWTGSRTRTARTVG